MSHDRVLGVEGAPNFRDLGGYAAGDGRTVKWRMVYRSDDLSDLAEGDLDVIERTGVATIVDFRDRAEAAMNPDIPPSTAKNLVSIPIEAGRLFGDFGGRLTRRKAMGLMISVYRSFINDYQGAYRAFFTLLAEAGNVPLLFHCTAGKDRTGLAAALFLSALGVARETIMADYLLSRDCLKSKYVLGVDYDEHFEPLYSVFPEFLEAAFEAIDSGFGGMDAYLRENLGVDAPALRAAFTE